MNDYEKLLYKSNRQKHQLKILQDKCRKYNFTINNLQSKIDKAIEYLVNNINLEMDDFTKMDLGCNVLKILDLDKYNEFLEEDE